MRNKNSSNYKHGRKHKDTLLEKLKRAAVFIIALILIFGTIAPIIVRADVAPTSVGALALTSDSTTLNPAVGSDGVAHSLPRNQSLSFKFNKNIQFSEDLNLLIQSEAIRVEGIDAQFLSSYYDVVINGQTLQFNFKPGKLVLNQNTWYKVVISKNSIVGTDNSVLSSDISYQFVTTYDNVPPTAYVSNYYNYNSNGTLNNNIAVNFNKSMNVNSVVTGVYDSSIYLSESTYNPSTNKWDGENRIYFDNTSVSWNGSYSFILKTSSPLKYNNKYKLVFPKGSVRDTSGIPIEYAEFPFTTQGKYYDTYLQASVKTDTGIDLTNGYYYGVINGVLPTSSLELYFNKDVIIADGRSLNEIKLQKVQDNQYTDVTNLNFNFNTGTTVSGSNYSTVFITPTNNFLSDTNYVLTVPAGIIYDRSGNGFWGGTYYFKTSVTAAGNMELYNVMPSTIKYGYAAGTQIRITGKNFGSDSKVRIISQDMEDGTYATVVGATYLNTQVLDSNNILVTLPDSPRITNTGTYGVSITSAGRTVSSDFISTTNTSQRFQLLEGDRPTVSYINILNQYIDEKSIDTIYVDGQLVSCARISIAGQNATIDSSNIQNLNRISIQQVNSPDREYVDIGLINTMISEGLQSKLYDDTNKLMYIPLKALDSGCSYKIIIPAGIFKNSTYYNNDLVYAFSTMSVPYVSSIDMAYAMENYQQGSNIVIHGSNFVRGYTYVKLTRDRDYYLYPDWSKSNDTVLYVNLPQVPQLIAGNYKLTVVNDTHHQYFDGGSIGIISKGITDGSGDKNSSGSSYSDGAKYIFSDKTYTLTVSKYLNGGKTSLMDAINIKSAEGGRKLPQGLKITSSMINITLDKGVTVKANIKIKYYDGFSSTLSLYYYNFMKNTWIKLPLNNQKIDKVNRTIGYDFDSRQFSGTIVLAAFK